MELDETGSDLSPFVVIHRPISDVETAVLLWQFLISEYV
jgi:hypothetical protein